eukprot:527241-Pyramimonas_sp.AAC.1
MPGTPVGHLLKDSPSTPPTGRAKQHRIHSPLHEMDVDDILGNNRSEQLGLFTAPPPSSFGHDNRHADAQALTTD